MMLMAVDGAEDAERQSLVDPLTKLLCTKPTKIELRYQRGSYYVCSLGPSGDRALGDEIGLLMRRDPCIDHYLW